LLKKFKKFSFLIKIYLFTDKIKKIFGVYMVIKINNEIIDAKIENEKNAFDVLYEIARFLKKDNMVITNIRINNEDYNLEDEKLKNIEIDKITEINVEASSVNELIENLLLESIKILQNIIRDIKINGLVHYNEFIELFNWMMETLEVIKEQSIFYIKEIKVSINSINKLIEFFDSNKDNEKQINYVIDVINGLITYIEIVRQKYLSNINVNKDELKILINEVLNFLPQISELFQSGKDNEAYNKINKTINVLENCCFYLRNNLNSFEQNKKNQIKELYQELNVILSDLLEAFENDDIVLIGDIMEYELGDKLKKYIETVLD